MEGVVLLYTLLQCIFFLDLWLQLFVKFATATTKISHLSKLESEGHPRRKSVHGELLLFLPCGAVTALISTVHRTSNVIGLNTPPICSAFTVRMNPTLKSLLTVLANISGFQSADVYSLLSLCRLSSVGC